MCEHLYVYVCALECDCVIVCIRICEYMSVYECAYERLSIFKSMLVHGYVCESMCECVCIWVQIGAEIFISFESKSNVCSASYDTHLFLAFFR